VSARVPLELVPVGARVTIYGRDGELDIDDATGEVLAQGTDPRFLNFPRTLVSNGACYRHGLYLAEVIDAPAPQQPRGEEVDPRDAEIGRLRDALWKYGQHLYACTSSECRCGLAAAIKDQP
jgi:hypothetical protein